MIDPNHLPSSSVFCWSYFWERSITSAVISLFNLLPCSRFDGHLVCRKRSWIFNLHSEFRHLDDLRCNRSLFLSTSCHFVLERDREGRLLFVFTYVLAALKEVYGQEKTRSRTDYLTGIANRRFFFEQAEVELKRARRYNHSLTVVYIDVDDFKRVNDRFGHDTGDAVLRVVARTVSRHLRLIDVIARLGGDEFAILLPETGYDASRRVIHKLQEGLRGRMQEEGWPITFSIGAISYANVPESIDEMLKRADSLMYSVKKSSKNTIRHDQVNDSGMEFFHGG